MFMRIRIGFLGLGTMGAPLANDLRKAGYEMTVWNRTRDKAEPLVKKGVALASTPRECATDKDLVFTCLADEQALDSVLDGPDGALAGIGAGGVLVDTSTAGVRATRSIEARVRAKGGSLVAAPLLGTRAAAEKAQLIVLVGGPAEARERAHPALRAFSARLIELETAEQASLMKLVVQAVGGAMMAGFAEALALGASGGLDIAKMVETIQISSFHSPLYLIKGDQILHQDWSPRFPLARAEQDQRLAQEAATAQGTRLPVAEAVQKLFAEVAGTGRSDSDIAAVADLLLGRVHPG